MSSRHLHESSITPEGVSTFEYIVRQLRLSPEEYTSSAALKEWVRRHKDHKYVPSQLLEAWHFEVKATLFGKMTKPKRAA
jgi:hypothetical protein